MYKVYIVIVAVICLQCGAIRSNAQDVPDFQTAADSMGLLMQTAEASASIEEKEQLSAQFQSLLLGTLEKDYSFDYPFNDIPHVSTLVSDADSLVRVFTWCIPTQKQGVFRYFGIIQHRNTAEAKTSEVFLLEDTKASVMIPEQEVLKYPKWYGCLYHQIVEKTDGKNKYYTLMGYDFNNGISKKRYIEVLTFDKRGNPVFGAPVFLLDKKPQKRVVFEYTSQSVMKLYYDKQEDKIIFNYLFPIAEEKKNDKSYYVPDITYEGMMFKLGKWIKIPKVDVNAKD